MSKKIKDKLLDTFKSQGTTVVGVSPGSSMTMDINGLGKPKSKLEEIKEQVRKLKENMPSPEERKKQYELFLNNIQQTLFYYTKENPFSGGLLQELDLKVDESIPTAALHFNRVKQKFELLFNPFFFNHWNLENRTALLSHEVHHFTSNHLFRLDMKKTGDDDNEHKYLNIAADMSINQFIKNLPEGGVNVEDFKLNDGTPYPKYKSAEEYFDLIKQQMQEQQEQEGQGQKGKGNTKQMMEKFIGDGTTIDEHGFDSMSEEDKAAMADEIRSLCQRTMEKTRYGKDNLPGGFKELLLEVETFLEKMNYKKILQQAIKKNVSSVDRTNTWYRPNKYYGKKAQGSTVDKLPNLTMYVDTSGSISVVEMNQFLKVVNGFLKSGTRQCWLGLWHTKMYYKKKYKLNGKINNEDVQGGGTDATGVIEDINKTAPNLSIVLTDGYYDTGVQPKFETIVVISENGTVDHPLKNHPLVKTITMKGLTRNT